MATGFTHLYGMQSGLFIKVGWSRNPSQRLREFQAGNPHPLRMVLNKQVREAIICTVENRVHFHLHRYAIGREWFMTDLPTVRAAVKLAMAEVSAMSREFRKWEMAAQLAHDAGEDLPPMPQGMVVNPHRHRPGRKKAPKPSRMNLTSELRKRGFKSYGEYLETVKEKLGSGNPN